MTDLSAFPITKKWPAEHPDRIQLYSLPTPNGVKVSIMLEETGLPYEPHLVRFDTNDQMSAEFLSLNPNNKIPAIIDPNGPDGKPLPLFESGAILIYLADKAGQLIPKDAAGRYEAIQWVMFQMGGIGPMFGQVGFFHKFAGKEYEDKRPRDRYIGEAKRLLAVLDQRLEGRDWILGDQYSIADIATFPWVRNLVGFYEAGDLVGIDEFSNVKRVLAALLRVRRWPGDWIFRSGLRDGVRVVCAATAMWWRDPLRRSGQFGRVATHCSVKVTHKLLADDVPLG